jgi:DNA-binding GntR family transcriptional regulator
MAVDSRPISAMTKSEAAYLEIRERIFAGALQPGSVHNQEALAASLGLSTTPLREALRRLESEGLVQLKAHRDMAIAPLTPREVHELYAVRLQLDPYAAALTAQNAPDDVLSEIVRLAKQPAPETIRSRLSANRLFHRTIYAASGNHLLTQFLDSLWDRTDRYRLLLLQEKSHVAAAGREHRTIAGALTRRDAEEVRRLMFKHVAAAEDLIVELAGDLLASTNAG